MPGLLERVRRLWGGAKLPTYDAACEELGGVPWRAVPEATDRWFLPDPKTLNGGKLPTLDNLPIIADKPPTLDSFVIKKPMSDASKLMLLGGGALTAIALTVVGLVAPSRVPTSLPAAAVAPSAHVVAAPSPTAPTAPSTIAPTAPSTIAPSAPAVTTRATLAPAATRPKVASTRRIVVARNRRR